MIWRSKDSMYKNSLAENIFVCQKWSKYLSRTSLNKLFSVKQYESMFLDTRDIVTSLGVI